MGKFSKKVSELSFWVGKFSKKVNELRFKVWELTFRVGTPTPDTPLPPPWRGGNGCN